MTLPTSGPLSLNDIKNEFGGPASPSLSNYYAGGAYVPAGVTGTYGAVPTSGAISIRNFYGTSNYLDIQTVTVGFYSDVDNYLWGYSTGAAGSISDGTFNPLGGATIVALCHNVGAVFFNVAGVHANSGWTSLTVNGNTYTRASATYYTDAAYTYWYWSASNPFTQTIGATNVVYFR